MQKIEQKIHDMDIQALFDRMGHLEQLLSIALKKKQDPLALKSADEQLALLTRGMKENSAYVYKLRAKKFIDFIGFKQVYTRDDVLAFLDHRRAQGITAIRFEFIIIRQFFKRLGLPWEFERNETPKKNTPRRPFYMESDMRRLLNCSRKNLNYRNCRYRKTRLRDYAMLRVAAILGPRRNELKKMNRSDFRPPLIYIGTSKGGEPLWRTLDQKTIRAIKQYLATRTDDNPALFISSRGNRLENSTLSTISLKIRRWAGINIPKAGWHAFRRGLTTMEHNGGLSETELMEIRGWKTREMPGIYCHLIPTKVEKKAQKINPFFK